MKSDLLNKLISPITLLTLASLPFAGFAQGNTQTPADEIAQATLKGYQEVPPVSSAARGTFQAQIDQNAGVINYQLTYEGLEGNTAVAHIHFGEKHVAGAPVVILCSNLESGPQGVQQCPYAPATITGTIRETDVLAGATAQGIDTGELNELIEAIRAGATYVNVHSTKFPEGEIRGQIKENENDQEQNGNNS